MASDLPGTEPELSDAQILELTQKLKDEESTKSMLVADKPIGLDMLREEYLQGSDIFLRKINYLQFKGYKAVRKIRGDGDCFYRALIFSLVDNLMQRDEKTRQNFISRLAAIDDQTSGFADRDIVKDFAEPLLSLLSQQRSQSEVLQAFNDPETSNASVVYLRLITSAELRRTADDVFPYLFSYEDDTRILDPETGMPSVVAFCQHYVEAINRDADHLMIQALTKALDVSMQIAYLDQSKGSESGAAGVDGMTAVDFISFQEEGAQFSLGDSALLLTPGHYNILLNHYA